MLRANMKIRLGLLQLGERSTQFYQELIDKQEQLADLQVVATDFPAMNTHLPNQFEYLETLLISYLDLFESVDKILIPNITLHETLDRVLTKINFHKAIVAHPLNSMAIRLKEDGCKKICLVASLYSMNSNYLHDYFKQHDIDVVLPNSKVQTDFDELRKKFYLRAETTKDIKFYHEMLHTCHLQAPVVSACTELSLMLPDDHQYYDMSLEQVRNAFTINN